MNPAESGVETGSRCAGAGVLNKETKKPRGGSEAGSWIHGFLIEFKGSDTGVWCNKVGWCCRAALNNLGCAATPPCHAKLTIGN
jgi:hypothetical protein